MAILNWLISGDIDGRKTELVGKVKKGGFKLTIYQRNEGGDCVAALISGFAHDNGRLNLTIRVNDGRGSLPIVSKFDTDR